MDFFWLVIGIHIVLFIVAVGRKIFVSAGQVGENAVARRLRWLPKDEYFVINDLLLDRGNGYSTQIDHVVVSPYGVFVIETKNIYGYIHGSDNSKLWRSCWRNRDLSFDNPILQNEAHIKALEGVLRDKQIKYIPIIAFSTNAELQVSVENTHVIYWSQVRRLIRRYNEPTMTIEQAKQIYDYLKAVNDTDKDARAKHSIRAQINKNNYKQRQIESVANGKCPRCSGLLVKRQGKFGAFYGCINYPSCRYTTPAAE